MRQRHTERRTFFIIDSAAAGILKRIRVKDSVTRGEFQVYLNFRTSLIQCGLNLNLQKKLLSLL